MNNSILERLERLERTLKKKDIRGVVYSVNPDMGVGGCARVKYGDNQVSGWLPVKPIRSGVATMWWFPDVGEGVTVTDIETGEVVCGSFTESHPPPTRDRDVMYIGFGDGGFISHNRATGALKIETVQTVDVITNNLTATVKSATINADEVEVVAPKITSTGEWTQNGAVIINGTVDISDAVNIKNTLSIALLTSMAGGFAMGSPMLSMSSNQPQGFMYGNLTVLNGEIDVMGVKVSKHIHNDIEGRPVGLPI